MLSVSNVEVYYHRVVQALRGLSFDVPKGKVVALLGANGAGKTTALKAVSGLLPLENGDVTDGDIVFDGRSVLRQEPHNLVRRGMAHVREGRRVFADLTVHDNLVAASFALTGRKDSRADFDDIYDLFPRLKERRTQLAGYLSGGEQQMLALGRALIGKPEIILLDEPSLGLAPKLVLEIFDTISRLNEERGATILLVEQNANVAFAHAHYGYILENGRVVIEGTVDKLRDDDDVREFYLGVGGTEKRSFRDVKHYKRRKRWLS
ncbi:MAG: ABC transporter ATP-binding protein [Proteobacteria bacterium]|nr:ABC transporter ATP-binding protein [Pseudomonadota bacterium]MDA1058824.1 ABC transporter ATP-binding protein [Pseudomonadota bacterium]